MAAAVAGVTVLLLVLQIVSAVRIGRLERDLAETRGAGSVLTETREKVDFLEQNLYYVGKTANDIRGVLNLPPVEFSFFNSRGDVVEADPETDSNTEQPDYLELAAYDGLDLLTSHNRVVQGRAVFFEARQQKPFRDLVTRWKLKETRSGPLSLTYSREQFTFFTLDYEPEGKVFRITERNGESQTYSAFNDLFYKALEAAAKQADTVLAAHQEHSRHLAVLAAHPEMEKTLKTRWVALEKDPFAGGYRELRLKKRDGTPLFAAGYDPEENRYYLTASDKTESFGTYPLFEAGFFKVLKDIDDRPAAKIAVSESQAFVERMFTDPAFVAMLEKNGYKPVVKPRHPDSDFYYYDLLDKKGKRVGSYAVEATTGRIFVMDAEEQPLRALTSLRPEAMISSDTGYHTDEEITAISDLFTSSDSVNILLVGMHENNTDTMIVVHADRKTRKAVMFSLPRDLWIKGRRINSYYGVFGRDRLVSEVSELTGLKIDYYMFIEMFAFIEVVDLLGGIEVSLTEDLIDPYYKYKDADGREVTLLYRKGTHHLSGREALRVARSRYTSSDYSRSKRQQLIVMGIKDRIAGLSMKDMGTALNLLKTVSGYLETNMSAAVILRLLKDYGQCDVAAQNTIDTSNVLYASYSNIYLLSEEERKAVLEDENYDKGAWICLPRNNDWNLIKWYVRKLISR